jgi:hypothetical protein
MADKPTVPSFTANSTFQAAKANELADDLATAIEGCLGRGGTGESPNSMTGNLDMDLNKIQNLGVPSSDNDAVRLVDLSDSDATGSASAQLRADLVSEDDNYGVDLVGNATRRVDTYTELVALTSQDANDIIILGGRVSVGDGGSGLFYWDTSDLSTEVTADTQRGVYVPPTSDATGASGSWVRQYSGKPVDVKWFGAEGDGVTDDSTAFVAWGALIPGNNGLIPPGQYVIADGFTVAGDDTHITGYSAELLYSSTETFNHCIRLRGNDCSIKGLTISCDSGLVRDDTGYGISLGVAGTKTINNLVEDCVFNDIASAAIWATNVDYFKANGNYVFKPKADGIHSSDGCFYSVYTNNFIYFAQDDSLAIINDVVGSPYVGSFLIDNNAIMGGALAGAVASHGISIVGGLSGVISNNFIQETLSPGIGFWKWMSTTQAPKDVLVIGNRFVNCSTLDTAGSYGVGVYVSEGSGIDITGNKFTNMGFDAGVPATGCVVVNETLSKVNILGNSMYDNDTYGVNLLASTRAVVQGNSFGFCNKYPIYATGTNGKIDIVANTFNDTSVANNINVSVTGEVYINSNMNNLPIVASATVKLSLDDALVEETTPTITSATGTITTSACTLKKQYKGQFVSFTGTIAITTNGTGAGSISIPLGLTALSGSGCGREVSVTGNGVLMDVNTTSTIRLVNYDNSYPGGDGHSLVFEGQLALW